MADDEKQPNTDHRAEPITAVPVGQYASESRAEPLTESAPRTAPARRPLFRR
jgi:hypothetical protein